VDGCREPMAHFHRYPRALFPRQRCKREVMPGKLVGRALENFTRDAASTVHHQTCTAKMGRDEMSVVDSQLRVYNLR
jgi:choline dehydrogenase